MQAKQLAGEKAASYIQNNMTVGLGTGSTAYWAIKRIGERVEQEGLNIRCLATSKESERLAREWNIPIVSFSEIDRIDITIDGADEINPALQMIKGGGGALLREKIIAYITNYYIIVADETKCVDRLGKFRLPIEIIPFGWEKTALHVEALGAKVQLRQKNQETFITDNGNYILDGDFGWINNLHEIHHQLHNIPGVVECGLFLDMTNKLIIGKNDGSVEEVDK